MVAFCPAGGVVVTWKRGNGLRGTAKTTTAPGAAGILNSILPGGTREVSEDGEKKSPPELSIRALYRGINAAAVG